MSIRTAFGMDYKALGTSKNINLPNWINLEQINGVIILKGIPNECDVDEILIRIYKKNM